MKRIIVIGAGASGMMAALVAAEQGAAVTILEKNDKPGKKLLVTGNGKCNLTYAAEEPVISYRGNHPEFAEEVLRQFPQKETMQFFRRYLMLKSIKNGIYPFTEQAVTVLEVFQNALKSAHVKLKTREEVVRIEKREQEFIVHTGTWHYEADAVILACGSQAAPATGAGTDGYELAKALGHTVTDIYPALVPLKIREELFHSLSGLRSSVRTWLTIDGVKGDTEEGELQWTSYGVSGIVIFQLSRYASKALGEGKKVCLNLSLLTEEERNQAEVLLKYRQKQTMAQALCGVFPEKLSTVLLKACKRKPGELADEGKLHQILDKATHLTLTVAGTKSFDSSQVCAGGIHTEEIQASTMESKVVPGLYMTGELIDIDGACGGYNLQWAWSTGYIAGSHAAR